MPQGHNTPSLHEMLVRISQLQEAMETWLSGTGTVAMEEVLETNERNEKEVRNSNY